MRKPRAHPFPPLDQAVDQAVARHLGGDAIKKQLIGGREEDPHRRYGRLRLEIMVRSAGRDPILPPTGERSHLDCGFRIQRDTQGIGCGIGVRVDVR